MKTQTGVNHICCICKNEYKSRTGIYYHIRKVHKLEPKKYWEIYYLKNKCSKELILSKFNCKLCGKLCNGYRGLVSHFTKHHGISSKEYYDKFLKSSNENVCKICFKETIFLDIQRGYQEVCSEVCSGKDKDREEKKKKTNKEKYGVPYASQNKEIQDKIFATCFENFGTKFPMQNKEIKESRKLTCLEKYGVDSVFKVPEIQNKRAEKLIERYGVKSPLLNPILNEKKINTCIEKYGARISLMNKIIKEKAEKTNIEKYGTPEFASSEAYRKIGEEQGRFMPLAYLTEFERYRRLVDIETRKHLKELYKNWNGLCFYTNILLFTQKEFKKLFPYLSLDYKKLRSVDHKKSKMWCFKNLIPPEVCGRLENLVVCSESINYSKNIKTESEFIKYLHEQKKAA
jgi:hypothetical protein